MFALLIGYQYRSAAVVSDQPAPCDDGAVSLVEELRGQPGTRVPHAWVQHAERRVTTLDLVGSGFTLFTGSAGAAWVTAASAVSAALEVPIRVHRIGAHCEMRDIEDQWAQLVDMSPDGALLVRPDGFVAWRTGALPPSPENRLSEVLGQILGRAQ